MVNPYRVYLEAEKVRAKKSPFSLQELSKACVVKRIFPQLSMESVFFIPFFLKEEAMAYQVRGMTRRLMAMGSFGFSLDIDYCYDADAGLSSVKEKWYENFKLYTLLIHAISLRKLNVDVRTLWRFEMDTLTIRSCLDTGKVSTFIAYTERWNSLHRLHAYDERKFICFLQRLFPRDHIYPSITMPLVWSKKVEKALIKAAFACYAQVTVTLEGLDRYNYSSYLATTLEMLCPIDEEN